MDEHGHDSDDGTANKSIPGVDGDANNAPSGDAGAAKNTVATPIADTGGTGQDVTAAIADRVTYSVTIEDAQQHFAKAHRKVPSIRSLQRYCEEGKIIGLRTPVTYDDGTHASPWFINAASLDAYIKKQPVVVLGDAGDAKPPVATPNREVGDANNAPSGDAGAANSNKDREARPPVPPASELPGIPLSEVLLENARLQERLEGKNEILKRIEEGYDRERKEWHSERDFLRMDVTETRALVRDFKSVSDRILDTFKQIGTKQPEAGEVIEPGQIVYRPVQKDSNPTGESRPA